MISKTWYISIAVVFQLNSAPSPRVSSKTLPLPDPFFRFAPSYQTHAPSSQNTRRWSRIYDHHSASQLPRWHCGTYPLTHITCHLKLLAYFLLVWVTLSLHLFLECTKMPLSEYYLSIPTNSEHIYFRSSTHSATNLNSWHVMKGDYRYPSHASARISFATCEFQEWETHAETIGSNTLTISAIAWENPRKCQLESNLAKWEIWHT